MKDYINRVKATFDKIAMDEYRYRVQLVMIPGIFGLIAFVMVLVNIIDQRQLLGCVCAAFCLYCILTVFIAIRMGEKMIYAKTMFSVGIVVLFTFFLITGEADGFSALWISMLPCFSLLMFGTRWGSCLSLGVFLELVIMLDTPVYDMLSIFHYSYFFKERYPIFYLAMFVVGFIFEKIREITHDKLVEAREMYRNIASIDSLTKLYNRHGFNRCIHNALNDTRERTWLSVLMMDIDYFKCYNDTYGHLKGDEVLEQVSKVLQEVAGYDGEICRWGGEEFIVVVNDYMEEDAAILAQKIRKAVFNLDLENRDTPYEKITVSIGVFSIRPTKSTSQEEIVNCADIALYYAKEQGRNCVNIYGSVK